MSKTIVLLADGTGHGGANAFRTNVWKTYEAVDHGPAPSSLRPQIAYYDDGVGTAEFRPLALLGGVFGLGLKQNVLEMYRFVCRNYRDGDDIYAFGFSRGAFTVRLAVAMMASQGLVVAGSEAELARRSRVAYRAFRRSFLPRRLQWPTRVFNLVRARLGELRDRLSGRAHGDRIVSPVIRFVGVWDTVSAYGGPANAITRTIDNWLYALSTPAYQLSERVLTARHALALDDARESFHPMLWDEVHEAKLIAAGRVHPERLQQVWFPGMHADVGGGYPEEALSAVPLLWMLEEAERCGLRTLTVHKDRYVALADSQGRIHNSRKGLGIYYRYRPRRISVWLDPPEQSTLGLRDPVIVDDSGRARGLLRRVKVHESVIGRILNGTDDYAPLGVPASFEIVPAPDAADGVESILHGVMPGGWSAMSSGRVDTREGAAGMSGDRIAAMERAWDLVWWRQRIYSVMFVTTALLLILPLIADVLPQFPRTRLSGLIRLIVPNDPQLFFLPDAAAFWLEAYKDNLLISTILGAVLFLCVRAGLGMERRVQDHARSAWVCHGIVMPAPTARPVAKSWTYRWRTNRFAQRVGQLLKWSLLPDWVMAPILFAVAMWISFAVYCQVELEIAEQRGIFCQTSQTSSRRDIARTQLEFSARDLCSVSIGRARKNSSYKVTFKVTEAWFFGQVASTPVGLSAWSRLKPGWMVQSAGVPPLSGYVDLPMLRAVDANILQPVIEIRASNSSLRRLHLEPLTLVATGEADSRFEGRFTSSIEGDLFLFANNVVNPLQMKGWDVGARSAHGKACVIVEDLDYRQAASWRNAGDPCQPLTSK